VIRTLAIGEVAGGERREINVNEAVQHARDVALGILQPTQREIERGMALHRDAIVCESYGLGLRAAVDGDAVAAAVDAGASDLEIQDMVEDMSMTRCVTDPREREEYRAAWEASGVTCILQNAGEEGNAPLRLIKRLARYTYVTDMIPDVLRRAATPDDILAAKKEGKHCMYMMCNGVPLPQDWVSVQEELRYIRVFHQLGCRMMHLTYNRRNMIGDGCAETANAGLSDFGRAVVKEMNRVGVVIDVAHSGWQTCLDAARVSDRPVVVSHSCAWSLNQHHRCKPDEVIRAIVDTGGTIGITNVPAFLGGRGDISTMLDHVDYVAKRFGVDHVTIGTDRAYVSSAAAQENAKIPSRAGGRMRWEALWRRDDPIFAPEWRQERQVQSLAWTNWPIYTVGLVQRGYSDDQVRKILGGNMLRVMRAVWQG
jgi:membrane dipeptidase